MTSPNKPAWPPFQSFDPLAFDERTSTIGGVSTTEQALALAASPPVKPASPQPMPREVWRHNISVRSAIDHVVERVDGEVAILRAGGSASAFRCPVVVLAQSNLWSCIGVELADGRRMLAGETWEYDGRVRHVLVRVERDPDGAATFGKEVGWLRFDSVLSAPPERWRRVELTAEERADQVLREHGVERPFPDDRYILFGTGKVEPERLPAVAQKRVAAVASLPFDVHAPPREMNSHVPYMPEGDAYAFRRVGKAAEGAMRRMLDEAGRGNGVVLPAGASFEMLRAAGAPSYRCPHCRALAAFECGAPAAVPAESVWRCPVCRETSGGGDLILVATPPPDPREARRREIDAVLAEDARRFPAFATARRCAVMAACEPATVSVGWVPVILDQLRAYEDRRGGLRDPSEAAVRYVDANGQLTAFAAYERARGLS